MPKAFPVESRHDVVAVARKWEATLTPIAMEFRNLRSVSASQFETR
jgi:hypothetical protein